MEKKLKDDFNYRVFGFYIKNNKHYKGIYDLDL